MFITLTIIIITSIIIISVIITMMMMMMMIIIITITVISPQAFDRIERDLTLSWVGHRETQDLQ